MYEEFGAIEFFETDASLAEAGVLAVDHFTYGRRFTKILDVGAGTGRYGAALRKFYPDAHIAGIEISSLPPHPAYTTWVKDNYLTMARLVEKANLVLGNPAFTPVEEMIEISIDNLEFGGILCFLVRAALIAGQDRNMYLYQSTPWRAMYILPERPSFTANGHTDTKTEYAYILFQKGYRPSRTFPQETHTLWWKDIISVDVPPINKRKRRSHGKKRGSPTGDGFSAHQLSYLAGPAAG